MKDAKPCTPLNRSKEVQTQAQLEKSTELPVQPMALEYEWILLLHSYSRAFRPLSDTQISRTRNSSCSAVVTWHRGHVWRLVPMAARE